MVKNKMNKKGMSPLIATVLIIGFTVALAGVIMLWGYEFIESLQEPTVCTSGVEGLDFGGVVFSERQELVEIECKLLNAFAESCVEFTGGVSGVGDGSWEDVSCSCPQDEDLELWLGDMPHVQNLPVAFLNKTCIEHLQKRSFISLQLYDGITNLPNFDSGLVYFENKGIDYRWYFSDGHWNSDWSLPRCPYNITTDTLQCGIMTVLIGDEWSDFRGIICRYDVNNIDPSYERVEIDIATCEYVYNDLGDSYSLIEETDQIRDIPLSPSFNHLDSEKEITPEEWLDVKFDVYDSYVNYQGFFSYCEDNGGVIIDDQEAIGGRWSKWDYCGCSEGDPGGETYEGYLYNLVIYNSTDDIDYVLSRCEHLKERELQSKSYCLEDVAEKYCKENYATTRTRHYEGYIIDDGTKFSCEFRELDDDILYKHTHLHQQYFLEEELELCS